MKFLKEKKGIIISFIIGVILASSITVYATGYLASQVTYKDGKTVEQALNDLYSKTENKDNFENKTYTQEGLSIFSNRITITNGGYYVDSENKTWVNITFKTNVELSGNDRWGLIKGLPNLNKHIVLTDNDNENAFLVKDFGGGNLGEICYFGYSETSLPKDATITLKFKY